MLRLQGWKLEKGSSGTRSLREILRKHGPVTVGGEQLISLEGSHMDANVKDRYELADALETQSGNLSGVRKRRALEFIDDKNICKTCSNAHITRQASRNASVVKCDHLGYVPNDIDECNRYQGVTDLSLNQMTQMAVLLDQRDLIKDSYL